MTRVLIVDDEKSMQITLKKFLIREGYEAEAVSDSELALKMMDSKEFDVIVTDIIMPRMSGIELISEIRKKSDTVQVIIMTGEPSVDTAIKAVQYSAYDYLTKPINKENFLKAVKQAEKIKLLNDEKVALEKQNHIYQRYLEDIVAERTNKLQDAMQGIILLISSVVEARDPYTAGHQRRVGNLSAAIAKKMKLESKLIECIRIIGYLHDVGKILIPIDILSKPGTLSQLEMEMIKNHSSNGYEMLMKASLPSIIGQTIFQHHERCDGSGYPRGLCNEEIALEAKILMVADVVEAMISHRPYRPALGIEAAIQEIKRNSGTLFDSEVVNSCIDLLVNNSYKIDDSEYKISFPLLMDFQLNTEEVVIKDKGITV